MDWGKYFLQVVTICEKQGEPIPEDISEKTSKELISLIQRLQNKPEEGGH